MSLLDELSMTSKDTKIANCLYGWENKTLKKERAAKNLIPNLLLSLI